MSDAYRGSLLQMLMQTAPYRAAKEAVSGFGAGLKNQAVGLYDVARNPGDTIQSAMQLALQTQINPDATIGALKDYFKKSVSSPRNLAQAVGENIGPGEALKALSLGKGIGLMAGMQGLRQLPRDNFIRKLGAETKTLYRETNASGLSDMIQGSYPFGEPDWHFAEAPEMALGQGKNKGLLVRVNSEELKGKANFGKPGLEKAYQDNMGEFMVRARPAELRKKIEEVFVTPAAFEGLRPAEKIRYERDLKGLEQMGVKVTRTDKLPGR